MLDAAAVVLDRLVELALLRRQVVALPLGDQLRLAHVGLVAQAILPWLDSRLEETILLIDASIVPHADVRNPPPVDF